MLKLINEVFTHALGKWKSVGVIFSDETQGASDHSRCVYMWRKPNLKFGSLNEYCVNKAGSHIHGHLLCFGAV